MRQFDRRLAYHFDWLLLVLTLLIIGGGLATIFSATEARVHTGFTNNPLVMRQAFYAGSGFIGMIAVVLVDYRRLERYAYVVYAGALVLLLAVPLVGSVGGGRRRWIDLRPGVDPAVGDDQDRVGDRARALLPPRPVDRRRTTRRRAPGVRPAGDPRRLILAQPTSGPSASSPSSRSACSSAPARIASS
jgi:hypothetical protein